MELTEDTVMRGRDRSLEALRRLDEIGVRLSVDDFGMGCSSLSLLRRLPVDEIKIDRSFVKGMTSGDGDAAIVRATVSPARQLGLSTVAEGVEDRRTLDALAEVGCDYAQGYLFCAPLAELMRRLEANSNDSMPAD